NPFPLYVFGRQMSPVFFEGRGVWGAFRYDECTAILRDHETWSSWLPGDAGEDLPEPSMLGSDPPRHTRLRGLVSPPLTPRMVEQLEPRIRQVANELVDRICERRECDVVEALTYPLPVIMIAEILGVPPEDRADFKRWSDEVIATLGSGIGDDSRTVSEQ